MPDMHQPASPDDDGVEETEPRGGESATDDTAPSEALEPSPGEPPERPRQGD